MAEEMRFLTPQQVRRLAAVLAWYERTADNSPGPAARGPRYGPPPEIWHCQVVATGPAGEADYTDERYWLKRVRPNNTDGSAVSAATLGEYAIDAVDRAIFNAFTATNLAEMAAHSHNLKVDDPVTCYQWADKSEPYVMKRFFVAGPFGTAEEPYAMLPADRSTVGAQSDTWDRDDQPEGKDGVTWLGPRVVYDKSVAGAPVLREYTRTVTYDSMGAVIAISAETARALNTPKDCTEV